MNIKVIDAIETHHVFLDCYEAKFPLMDFTELFCLLDFVICSREIARAGWPSGRLRGGFETRPYKVPSGLAGA
jgi:hypothetical protein